SSLFDAGASFFAGVRLGENTDATGKLYLTIQEDNGSYQVFAYSDSARENLVAQTQQAVSDFGDAVVLDQVKTPDGSAGSGLGITLSIDTGYNIGTDGSEFELQFNNLGARIYNDSYGSQSFLGVTQNSGGNLFYDYSQAGDPDSQRFLDVSRGSVVKYGQDATLNLNGSLVRTTGLSLNYSDTSIMAHLVFNSGQSGSTTIAQVGYGEGSLFTKNGSLAFAKSGLNSNGAFVSPYAAADTYFSGLLNNAGHNSSELLNNFAGGLKLQLDDSASASSLVGIRNMSGERLGYLLAKGEFTQPGISETRALYLSDILAGGLASLEKNPTLAKRIIDQADADVSMLRAQIGSFQSNALVSNENNLRTALANITAGEGVIRDADLALEATNLTRNMLLNNAGIAALAQSNSHRENIMKLFDWN
ncbi:MAG: hypothetical protein LBU79_08900, partial [Planctomycetota bacterium]|nr:hypothetical protein [Planctomycetota bacterium]